MFVLPHAEMCGVFLCQYVLLHNILLYCTMAKGISVIRNYVFVFDIDIVSDGMDSFVISQVNELITKQHPNLIEKHTRIIDSEPIVSFLAIYNELIKSKKFEKLCQQQKRLLLKSLNGQGL